jgi:tetratricopeptide (TPR) repeat protein
VAVGFTVLANSLLLATLVYRDWMAQNVQLAGYAMLTAIWLLAWWESRADRRREAAVSSQDDQPETLPIDKRSARRAEQREQWFREAQHSYLRGDWVATEQQLLKLLKQDAKDAESRLMLATLWRHQGRSDEALRQLDRLERLEAASEWKYEIAVEREAVLGKKLADEKQDAPLEHVEDINRENTNKDINEDINEDTPTEDTPTEDTPTEDTDRRMAA